MNEEQESHNIFKMLDIEKKENYHSQFIISVINSSDDTMKLFLKMLKGVVNGNAVIDESVKYKVIPEKTLTGTANEIESDKKNGRVDIFLSDKYEKTDKYEKSEGDKNRILIENKIYAGEQKGQIKRYYRQYWEDKTTEYKGALFYLTLEKKAATKYSAGNLKSGEDYFLLGYKEDIMPWLEKVKSKNDKLAIYIQDYLYILEELTSLSKMIETGCIYKDKKFITKYNSYLELRFWNYIEEILIKNNYNLINNRKYNYDKILQNHKGLGIKKNTFNYGIIFEDKSGTHFRIGVEVDKNSDNQYCLFESKGKFTNSKWEGELIRLKYKTNKLDTKSIMEGIAKEILQKLNQKYDLKIDFGKKPAQ